MKSSDYIDLLKKKEPLCPELKKYYSKGELFEMVRHPLLFSVPHSSTMNALLNMQLIERKNRAAKLLKEENYEAYVFMHERPYRFEAFKEIEQSLTDTKYWKMLSEIWTDSENTWQNLDEWKEYLKSPRKNKTAFMSKEDLAVYNSLPDMVTAYRGYNEEYDNKDGVSYSLSKAKAEWFSKRFHKAGSVKKIVIPKEKIFAYTSARGEDELIIL